MSMSTRVRGIVPPDETWKAMKQVWDACVAANVPVPGEVLEFFGDEPPDPAGVIVEIPVREYKGGLDGAGFEVDLASVPAHVKTIRFWNSW